MSKKKCLVEGCPRDAERSGYCTAHILDSCLSERRGADVHQAVNEDIEFTGTVPVDDRDFDIGAIKVPGTVPVEG